MRLLIILCALSQIVYATKTIVIDPGHGGRYVGTVSRDESIIEKDMALLLSKQLAQLLRNKGYTVFLTREDNTVFDQENLISDLKKRAQFATDHSADLFVSVHLNASANKQIHGYEVYVPYEQKFPIKSYQLASTIHYDLSHKIKPHFYGGTLGNLNALDRGIRASRFNVLMYTECPAVLVELGYLSHEPSAAQLKTKDYQDLLVDALYCGIRRYIIHEQQAASI